MVDGRLIGDGAEGLEIIKNKRIGAWVALLG